MLKGKGARLGGFGGAHKDLHRCKTTGDAYIVGRRFVKGAYHTSSNSSLSSSSFGDIWKDLASEGVRKPKNQCFVGGPRTRARTDEYGRLQYAHSDFKTYPKAPSTTRVVEANMLKEELLDILN